MARHGDLKDLQKNIQRIIRKIACLGIISIEKKLYPAKYLLKSRSLVFSAAQTGKGLRAPRVQNAF